MNVQDLYSYRTHARNHSHARCFKIVPNHLVGKKDLWPHFAVTVSSRKWLRLHVKQGALKLAQLTAFYDCYLSDGVLKTGAKWVSYFIARHATVAGSVHLSFRHFPNLYKYLHPPLINIGRVKFGSEMKWRVNNDVEK